MAKKKDKGNDGKRSGGHQAYKAGKVARRKAWQESAARETNKPPTETYTHRHSG